MRTIDNIIDNCVLTPDVSERWANQCRAEAPSLRLRFPNWIPGLEMMIANEDGSASLFVVGPDGRPAISMRIEPGEWAMAN